ncbi:MAG: ROK family transcriptional regulator [Succinivibrio sp.]|nr:ROK family transcriptional regulator [Succinivibrio sp.]
MNDLLTDPKQQNLERVLALFFDHDALSKPQVAELTGLSLPTVVGHIKELESQGLLGRGELLRSSGGRPALSYHLCAEAYMALGVEIRKSYVKMCLCDLRGQVRQMQIIETEYHDSPEYAIWLCDTVYQHLDKWHCLGETLVGVGVTLQAVVDKSGENITFSKIIPTAHFDVSALRSRLKAPVRLCHDVKCEAQAELWHNREITNAIYVALCEHLGGSLIYNRLIEHGRKGYAGAWEHMTMDPQGRQCYCGRRGCLETMCSTEALLQGESMNVFFNKLHQGEERYQQRWQTFLSILSRGLYQVWLILERRIILGGDMALWLRDEDVASIEEQIRSQSTFTFQKGFVSKAVVHYHAAAIGAALPFLAAYIPEHIRPIEPWESVPRQPVS